MVVGHHGELARSGARNGEQVAGRDVAGQVRLGGEYAAAPSNNGHRLRLADCGTSDANDVVATAMQSVLRAIAHVAVHNDGAACAVLHREDAVHGYPGGADNGASGLDCEAWDRDGTLCASLLDRAGEPFGEGGDLQTLIGGP
jgi:hypothetical protein